MQGTIHEGSKIFGLTDDKLPSVLALSTTEAPILPLQDVMSSNLVKTILKQRKSIQGDFQVKHDKPQDVLS